MMLKYLIIKEFKQIFRNSFLPKLFVMMPLMMIGVMPFAANQEVKNLNFAVADHDRSTLSERLVNKIAASQYFSLVAHCSSNEAFRLIESGDADIIFEIPQGFENDIVNSRNVTVSVAANGVNGTKSALASSYISGIVQDYSSDFQASMGDVIKFDIKPYYLFNPGLNYRVFMVPALMVMLLTLMCGFLPALNIVGEKEKGTMEQINVTPIGRGVFILSKLLPYWVIGLFVFTVSILLAWLFYGIVPAGSLLTVYVCAIVYISAVSGLGLVISNYASTMQQAMFLMFFFMLVFMLISGLFTPVSGMPDWAQWIAAFNPLKYFIEAMRMVFLKGSGIADLKFHLLALGIFATVLNSWAVVSYRKTE